MDQFTMVFTWVKQNFARLFEKPQRHQVAALCYRASPKGPEVLLITSRGSGRWILPKGWPMVDRSDGESALQEAYEEAGIHGEVELPMVGSYLARKKMGKGFFISIKTDVYAIKTSHQDNQFPESEQRKLAWHLVEEAIEQVEHCEISYVLKKWSTKKSLNY